MGWLDGIGSAISGVWNATVGRIFTPPAPPAPPVEPTLKMAQDSSNVQFAKGWENVRLAGNPMDFPETPNAIKPMAFPASGLPTVSTNQFNDSRVLQARANFESLMYDQTVPPRTPGNFRQVLRDALDVNRTVSYDDTNKFRAEISANQPLEAEKLQALSPEQRVQYQALAALVDSRPHAHLSLQMLLLEGKLAGPPSDKDGKSLLANLDALSKQPLATGLDRTELMSHLVQEIAVPSAINQQGKNTCTVTSFQIEMAMTQPSEYARLISGLASPEGKATLRDGSQLAREAGTEVDDGSGRSLPARLWQPALMERAIAKWDYDNALDQNVGGKAPITGLFAGAFDDVANAVTGRQVLTYHTPKNSYAAMERESGTSSPAERSTEDLIVRMTTETDHGHVVPVAVQWGQPDPKGAFTSSHEILVTKVVGDKVLYNNPWGMEEAMPMAEFKKRLQFATLSEWTVGEVVGKNLDKVGPPKERPLYTR